MEQYRGQFKSNDGVLYTAIISNDNYTGESEDIPHFESEGEIEISWDEVEKYDVIQGSEAKVRIISETDRRFIDMYTETPGSIRLDVYKNETPDDVEGIGTLYWSGCLDCEFYEEPYSEEKNYAVELTFTDFGILDRLKFDMTEVLPVTLQSIMERALIKSCIAETAFDETMIALNKTLSEIYIYTANFYDEDGEASTWKEVVEQILQPLSLRLIQRNGVLYIYDLHSLYNSTDADVIEWRGDNATLGVDKVFNNCKVTFSPYSPSTLVDDELEVTVDTSEIGQWTTNAKTFYKGIHYDSSDEYDQKKEGDKDFTLFNNPTFSNIIIENGLPISIRKIYNGDDADCIAMCYLYPNEANTDVVSVNELGEFFCSSYAPDYASCSSMFCKLFKTEKKFLNIYNGVCLRLSMQLFLDTRYNPFRDDTDNTNAGNMHALWGDRPEEISFGVFIRLYDAAGNVIYHYINSNAEVPSVNERGSWVSGDYSTGECAYLTWYNNKSIFNEIGHQGWIDNYQSGKHGFVKVNPIIENAPAGEYIPMPPTNGYIDVEVMNFAESYTKDEDNNQSHKILMDYVNANITWILFKAPKLEYVFDKSPYNVISADDIETNGVIDENAKEDLELDFNCGTPAGTVPLSRGTYYADGLVPYHSFTRAGRTDTAEQLFIGTCFSQYAKRNTTLNGDVKIDTGALKAYTDPYITKRYVDGVGTDTGESAKKFMMVEDVQQLSTDKSETKFVEFMKDIYTKK